MSRHVILALGLALVATATALLLADVGIFEEPGRWLFARYQEESLLKDGAGAVWSWLPPAAAGLSAALVAWVAVDQASWGPKLAVLGATLGAVAFLSLTLAFYGLAFNPWPGLAAAALAFAMGCLLAETPATRSGRSDVSLADQRLSPATRQAWHGRAEPPPWAKPGGRESAVLSVRVLSPAPASGAALHLDQLGRALGEITRFLRQRPGVVLDTPASDGVRAFFGFRPETSGGDLDEAARAALELATFLREEATLQTQAGQPVPAWGLGLSLGSLLTGFHGPDPERFWTASGPAVEQSRQLAALNARHHTTILVGRRAAEALAARFDLRAVEGDAIHALLAPKPAPAPEDLPHAAIEEMLVEGGAHGDGSAPASAPAPSSKAPFSAPRPPLA